jgi:hypothetical protein
MSQTASNQSESSKLKQLLNGDVDDSIKSRLPRRNVPSVGVAQPEPEVVHSSFAAKPGPESSVGAINSCPLFGQLPA